jgi:DNA-binding beta-propeller fold protein YncE
MELSLDPQGDLVVPDVDNNRVLLWSAATLAHFAQSPCHQRCSIPASRVWGQYGSFSTGLANNPHIPSGASARCTTINLFHPASACSLSGPSAAIVDAHGDLFVADTGNNRVLEYAQALSTPVQDAGVVYGQAGDFSSRSANRDGESASTFWHPLSLAFDPAGSLWVSDFDNMRVLKFPVPDSGQATQASEVLGQQGDFATNLCGASAADLCGPTSISFDPSGHAFIADGLNSRVLEFS